MSRSFYLFFLATGLSSLMPGCAEDASSTQLLLLDTENTFGSCVGDCGRRASDGNCWCDSGCAGRGDCCPDVEEVCAENPACDEVDCTLECLPPDGGSINDVLPCGGDDGGVLIADCKPDPSIGCACHEQCPTPPPDCSQVQCEFSDCSDKDLFLSPQVLCEDGRITHGICIPFPSEDCECNWGCPPLPSCTGVLCELSDCDPNVTHPADAPTALCDDVIQLQKCGTNPINGCACEWMCP